MTDAQFLSNNSITCETNHVKFDMLIQDRWAYKTRKNIEIGQGFRPCEATLCQKVEIIHMLGPHFQPAAPTEVKFCKSKRTHVR